MPTTQLNYDIVPDKTLLYTTVDQLNQSSAALTFTAKNRSPQPVTVSEILIELIRVDHGADAVQLLLPGSAGGIQFPNTITGPGPSTWTVKSDTDGQFTLTADGGATFQPGDVLTLTLQDVVIREGGGGTALVPVLEASDTTKGETEVAISITQSTLDVQLSVDYTMIAPGQTATLTWVTNDASSGTLGLPNNVPEHLALGSTNLVHGQQPVNPIGNTTYSLTCEGRGPSVMKQVNVTIHEVTASLFGSDNAFDATETITLSYQTSEAISCAISLQDCSGSVTVPFVNGQMVSCNVGATPDGQTLILTSADGSNQELGRLTLPNPCPLSVTFVLTAEGAHTSVQPPLTVNLLHAQIISFNQNVSSNFPPMRPGTHRRYVDDNPHYMLQLSWNVSHASSVRVAVNGEQASTSPSGGWQSGYDYWDPPSGTITCQGFGGPVGE